MPASEEQVDGRFRRRTVMEEPRNPLTTTKGFCSGG